MCFLAGSLCLSAPVLKMIRGFFCSVCSSPETLEGGGNRQHQQLEWLSLGCLSNLPGDIYCSLSLAISYSLSPVLDPGASITVSTVSSEYAQVPCYPYPVTTAPSISALYGSSTVWSFSNISGSLSFHLSELEGCHLRERGAAVLGRTRRSEEMAG